MQNLKEEPSFGKTQAERLRDAELNIAEFIGQNESTQWKMAKMQYEGSLMLSSTTFY